VIHTISARTCVEAWLNAANLLLGQPGREAYTVILDIEDPATLTPVDRQIVILVDEFLTRREIDPTSTVAGTIFPAFHYLRKGAAGVYRDFPDKVYTRIKTGWGTYAGHILRRTDRTGATINLLEILVNKIKMQLELPSTLRRAYELSLVDPFLDIPIYEASTDAHLTLRQPCLSHISFKVIDHDALMLTALYRSHYYLQRALGNLLGLSQLQLFVANETGLRVGELICHSSFACLETNQKWKVREVKDLLSGCASVELPTAASQGCPVPTVAVGASGPTGLCSVPGTAATP
jgi:hypothetical protein